VPATADPNDPPPPEKCVPVDDPDDQDDPDDPDDPDDQDDRDEPDVPPSGAQIVPPVWRYRARRAGSSAASSGHDGGAVRLTIAVGDRGGTAVAATRRIRRGSKTGFGWPKRKPM
jgi:hypothetical protein